MAGCVWVAGRWPQSPSRCVEECRSREICERCGVNVWDTKRKWRDIDDVGVRHIEQWRGVLKRRGDGTGSMGGIEREVLTQRKSCPGMAGGF